VSPEPQMATTNCLNDDDFGPVVKGCRDDFDFTLRFELIIFSLVPSSIFVLVALLRCFQLHKGRKIVDAKPFLAAKLVSNHCCACVVPFQLTDYSSF
jgi:ATP-binding cassette subfamily C (CFTR/MRP) protein 1